MACYCPIHHSPMTPSRRSLGGVMLFRCEACVAEARAKVKATIASFKADTSQGTGSRLERYAPAKTTVWRGPNTTTEQSPAG